MVTPVAPLPAGRTNSPASDAAVGICSEATAADAAVETMAPAVMVTAVPSPVLVLDASEIDPGIVEDASDTTDALAKSPASESNSVASCLSIVVDSLTSRAESTGAIDKSRPLPVASEVFCREAPMIGHATLVES